MYRSAPVSTGNTFQDLPQLREPADNTERYIDITCGPGSSVGIPRFFAHVQTGPEAHPASCTLGTGSFPGVKRPGRGVDHPTPSSAKVEKE
jgi:hypothetical protein